MTVLDTLQALADAEAAAITSYANAAGANTSVLNAAIAAATAQTKTVYVDGVGGNDTAPGFSPGTAVRTIKQAFSMASAGQALFIGLLSDVYVDPGFSSYAGQVIFFSVGYDLGGPIRTLMFDPGGVDPTTQPPSNMKLNAGATIEITSCNIRIIAGYSAAAAATGGAMIFGGGGNFVWYNGTLSVDAGVVVPLINALAPITAQFSGVTLAAGCAGHIFAGVAAGTNPNANVQYRTNLTSA